MAPARIDLVVTDLDGTLWDADEAVHDRTLAALRELERRGTALLVATGRRPRSAAAVLARYGLTPPAVLLDGALGIDLSTERVFHRSGYAADDAHAVLDVFLEAGVEPVLYVEEGDTEVIVGERPATHPEHLRRLGDGARTARDLHAVIEEQQILSFGVVGGDHATFESIATRLLAIGRPTVSPDLVFGGATIMVPPLGIDKWEGVLVWCAERGLDPERILAVGDGPNDLGLLERAAVPCAIRGGHHEALARCDHVLEPPGEGGWSAILELV